LDFIYQTSINKTGENFGGFIHVQPEMERNFFQSW